MNKKYISILFLFVVFVFGFQNSAFASWSFDLGNGKIVHDYYSIDILFNGDDSDLIDNFALTVGYDDQNLSYFSVNVPFYTREQQMPPFKEALVWGQLGDAQHDADNNLLANIAASIPPGVPGSIPSFSPTQNGENLMATIWFEILNINDFLPSINDVYFRESVNSVDVVTVPDDVYTYSGLQGSATAKMVISNDGQSVSPAAVPIPSAVFLLGGGLCALLGVGRRKDRG